MTPLSWLLRHTTDTLAVVSLACFAVACGDDDEETNDNNNNNNNGQTPEATLQQQAFDAGLINTVDATGLNVTSTLADGGTPAPVLAQPIVRRSRNSLAPDTQCKLECLRSCYVNFFALWIEFE